MQVMRESDIMNNFTSRNLSDSEFRTLSSFIETELGIKMPEAKRVMLESRLQKRVRTLNLSSFAEYLDLVFSDNGDSTEMVHMIDAVTTNKTDFFREPDHFTYMNEQLLPSRYEDGWGSGSDLKVWSTACSTGEEPYTLAMVLEDFGAHVSRFDYSILGTDISSQVLHKARAAVYTEERAAPIPDGMKKRYLLRSKDRQSKLVRIKPALRKRARFEWINLLAPSIHIRDSFHIIFCRNVIIYFERPNQQKLLRRLFEHLVPGGYLFLGHSETMAGMNLPLMSVAPTIYRKPQ